ncbi:formate dehydrogenase subunit delta [Actibacterium sp. XHP0104]|uniref:formate dehydrogenase subunit delta n=1 Tax=Actibacterium sp. XHP0104 TaxID=2984335 RepID=UPI0021E84554|nr:formate dehydrogenase subunit delta [Actibacterium sp. XHP0104]MCV2881497.1 formate dehydrogenase subunit delta [Actibacterium sp. XHP0104]
MSHDKLIYMANQIARAFAALPQDKAAANTATHINDFWDPRMRAQFLAHVAAGGEGLSEVALAAAAAVHPPRAA